MIPETHYQATNHKIESLLWEKYQKPQGNVEMSNNQEMFLQYTYISEGKHWGNSPRLASEHK